MQDHPVFVQVGDDGSGSHQLKPRKHIKASRGSIDATLFRKQKILSFTVSIAGVERFAAFKKTTPQVQHCPRFIQSLF